MLDKLNRLKKRKSFAYIIKNGKGFGTKHLGITYLYAPCKFSKIGFSVSKIVGKAFARNKTKRRLRAITRQNISKLPVNYNYVIRAKVGAYEISFDELKKELEYLFSKTEKL